MIRRNDFIATGMALLLAAGAVGGVAGPAWAVDTTETTASELNPGYAPAKSLVEAGKYGEALDALKKLDAQSPNNPDVLNLIGFSLRKTGHMGSALDYYIRALALKPDHLGANEYLGELYLELRQPAKAKERLETLRRACSDCEEFRDLRDKINQMAEAR